MVYCLYKFNHFNNKSIAGNNRGLYNIDYIRISPLRLFIKNENKSIKNAALRLYFWLFSHGKLWVYYVKHGHEIIHTSYVMQKSYKFPFMKKNDFEIGPCFTKSEYRGKGIYPSVINRIQSDVLTDKNSIYMIVRSDNISSIKGIEKSGFINVGFVNKKGKKYIYKGDQYD